MPDPSTEPHPGDELAAITADLRTWLAAEQRLASGPAWADLPATTLPPPEPVEAAARRPAARDGSRPRLPSARCGDGPRLPVARPPPSLPAAAPAQPSEAAPPAEQLASLRADLGDCTRCPLHRGRTQLVFGAGSPSADIVFVGEGPGYYEDQSGEPFVGKAGQLLDRIIENVLRLHRSDVYIANVVKCRPPDNRDPEPQEVAMCSPFLQRQLAILQPAVVVALGRFAANSLLGTATAIGRLRGTAHPLGGGSVVATYHPAYLLRNPEDKRKVFADMLLVRREYARIRGRELPPPLKGRPARTS